MHPIIPHPAALMRFESFPGIPAQRHRNPGKFRTKGGTSATNPDLAHEPRDGLMTPSLQSADLPRLLHHHRGDAVCVFYRECWSSDFPTSAGLNNGLHHILHVFKSTTYSHTLLMIPLLRRHGPVGAKGF